ncbi:MAG TPA: hypothetical protein VE954_40820 [Oligoflexus sp.]|uniref:hypothetical protein n=1 Tax=Oligoflexus sp. TaxID=1971216 RepID=UPI002D6BCB5D|nr:hypothetical protein [Oligoflexus sp.]HYX39484.1 hypothetical protein [Oligoflexus sp.]
MVFSCFAKFYQIGLILVLIIGSWEAQAASRATWNWSQSPAKRDWQTFMKMSEVEHNAAWKSLKTSGYTFEKLSWEWRTGWIQVCTRRSSKLCGHILQHGLFDRALVVRAEAASSMGERFANTGHAPALRLLATAYAVQQNKKGKDPLYVQFRILHAIQQIGGTESRTLGHKLAHTSPATARYWTRLAMR